jgi:N-acetylglutamate synthase-like GNAT family acetyltransferase
MVTYRQATVADSAHIVSLLREIMQHHGVEVPQKERLAAVVAAALDSPFHEFLLAESNGTAVGMCALVFTFSTWSAALACELQDVIVTESSRRGGVGEGLIQAAAARCRERGCVRLFLLAEAWNLEAQAFYRRQGMTEKTCLDFELDLRD